MKNTITRTKLETFIEQRVVIDNKIKQLERQKSQRGLFKDAKKVVGTYWRFRNKYFNGTDYWYIYAEVKGVRLVGSSVYIVLDTYELNKDNEIKISLNYKHLESTRPMHCWDSILEEVFEKNKQGIINQTNLTN